MRLDSKAVLKHTQSKRWRAGRMSFKFRADVVSLELENFSTKISLLVSPYLSCLADLQEKAKLESSARLQPGGGRRA
jgi:hypothetical protein